MRQRSNGRDSLKALNRYIGSGRICVPIAASYPLGKAARAHQRLDRGQVLGRIVLNIHRAAE